MATQLAELAHLVAGEILGDGAIEISGSATLEMALQGEISLLDGPDKLSELHASDASAVVVKRGIALEGVAGIVVDDVHEAFAKIICYFRPRRATHRIGVSAEARIDSSVRLGQDVDIYPGVIIGPEVEIGSHSTIHSGVTIMAGCRIGDYVTIFPNSVLYEDSIIGSRSILHAGVVIGAHGFGYDSSSGKHILSAQLGFVEIGDDVEIGAGTTIDRGTYGPTTVGEGTKIDDQVMIAHNCRIGRHNLICSQVGIAGSSTTGDYVVMAGQVGIRDHVKIGAARHWAPWPE